MTKEIVSPREIGARETFKVMTKEIISRGVLDLEGPGLWRGLG